MPPRTPEEALREAQRIANVGIFMLSEHAVDRMRERSVKRPDIIQAIVTATGAIYRESTDKKGNKRDGWRLEDGRDRAGDPLVVVVAFDCGMLIVTVFGGDDDPSS